MSYKKGLHNGVRGLRSRHPSSKKIVRPAALAVRSRREQAEKPSWRRSAAHDRVSTSPVHAAFAYDQALGYEWSVLEYVSSNLFESPAQTLVNTVNTVGVMGKGIANDFRRLYPEMFEKYRAFCEQGQFAVGQLYLYRTPHKWVLNFPTKQHWRNPSRVEWIEAGLKKFLASYSQYGITSVAFPQLGTGNGGLGWDVVRPVMERYLKQARIPVYVHVRPRDPKFVPEHIRPGEVASLSRELQAARADVTFEAFVNDLRDLFQARVGNSEDAMELPSLEVQDTKGRSLILPGEQVLDFWQSLRLRGALELASLPPALQAFDSLFAEKLVTLDYIKPMTFGQDGRPGLRYAPPSASTAPDSIDVSPE